MLKKIIDFFHRQGPQSLVMLAMLRRKRTTSKLYVMVVDFPMKEGMRQEFDKSLDPLREKYGLDFLVLEPGIRLKRFDDF